MGKKSHEAVPVTVKQFVSGAKAPKATEVQAEKTLAAEKKAEAKKDK